MLDPLTAARAQMEVSLGFHMIFSAVGIALPALMCVAEGLHLRTGHAEYMNLARTWAKATSLLFAVGAVSGTALSFELGLLWPRFMEMAGATIGGAFALEGYAFFLEAIFIGLYLYGWDRLSPRAHAAAGVVVAISGTASGVLVCAANAWMQAPRGFDPGAPFRSPMWLPMATHTVIASFVAVGFAVGGVYAAAMLRGRRDAYVRRGMTIGLAVAAIAAVAQLASGDVSARAVAENQPAKLAAMEAHFHSARAVPLLVGGLVDADRDEVRFAVPLPSGLSLLVAHDPRAEVGGLDRVPRGDRPPVGLVHAAFDLMVGCGMALLGVAAWFWIARLGDARRREERDPPRLLLRALVLSSPLGFVAIEAGWIVAEAGRQPWTVDHLLRTRDAVTPAQGVPATFAAFVVLYLALGAALVVLLRRLAARGSAGARGA